MKAMGKILNGGFGIFFAVTAALTLWSLTAVVGERLNSVPLSILLIIILAAAAYFLSAQYGRLEKLFSRHIEGDTAKADRIFFVFAAVLLLLQIIFVLSVNFSPRNDLSYVCKGAENLITGNNLHDGLPERHQHYFAVYPNNHMLLLIVYGLYKIEFALMGEITNTLPIILSTVGLNLSYILMYKTAKLMYTPEKALTCAVKGLLFTPLITYTQFFYTDSIAMPWITGALYFYMKWRTSENDSRTKSIINMILCGLLLAAAYKIKGSAAVFIPAAVIDMLFVRRKKSDKIISFVAFIAVFAALCILLGGIAKKVTDIDCKEMEKYRFPMIHWVMMSASGNGGYQYEDFMYTKSFEGFDSKVSADLDRLGDKLSKQGAAGFGNHLLTKLTYTWRDSSFMASYYYKNSFLESNAFYILTALCHFTLMFGIVRSYISRIKSKDDVLSPAFMPKLMLAGLTVFLLIWEARCRYLVSFFVLFALI